ncbi:helix-turn-helix domain-containing protein [Pseudonocardia alni]|uniref:helix-turn-helix domain-containing protein n=1 Tax=Pseudonocardia alni TaxID=33907 RepID=UPI00280C12F4|nr:helix-turn-helix domain-containing protein [Pseudonocardia alni]
MSTTDHAKPRTDFGAVVRIRYESAGQNPTTPERVADALYRLAAPQSDGSRTWTGTAADLSRHLDGVGVESVKSAVREFVREGLLHREGTTLVIPALLPDEPVIVEEPAPSSSLGDATDKPSTAQPSTATGKLREVDYRIAVMDAPGLSVGARYTGVAIARHCWRHGELFAGLDKISEWIGNSPESRKQTGKYVRELVSAGLLVAIGKAGRTTRYRLTVPD